MTVIHIKEDTKKLLMNFMLEIQQKKKKKVSFDDGIKYLLYHEKGKNKKRLLALFGCIDKEKAEKDLKEMRLLEERRFEDLSRTGS
jgi:hypothetical protein